MHSSAEINKRFFQAVDYLTETGKLQRGLREFCEEVGLNETRYYKLKAGTDERYKTVEVEAVVLLATKYKIRLHWLLLGRGSMI